MQTSQRVSTKVTFSFIYVKFRVFGTRTSLMPSTAASQRQRDLEKKIPSSKQVLSSKRWVFSSKRRQNQSKLMLNIGRTFPNNAVCAKRNLNLISRGRRKSVLISFNLNHPLSFLAFDCFFDIFLPLENIAIYISIELTRISRE